MPKSRSRRKPPPPRQRKPPKEPLVAVPAPGFRGKVERRSAPALVWLSARPKFLLPLLIVVLLIGGLAAPTPVGAPLLVLLLGLVAWLSYLSWPVLDSTPRLIRVALVGLLLAALAGKVTA